MIEKGRKHRAAVRYHGGKFAIAQWIIGHFPAHDCYTEAFGGGASVLLQKPRSAGEIYNDLDETMVQLFRVLRDPEMSAKLIEQLYLTPYARVEQKAAYEKTDDPVERARRTLVRSFQGYGSDGTNGVYPTSFRSNVTKAAKTPAREWANYPAQLKRIVHRMRGVCIEQCDALSLIERMDGPNTLHYVDPPYLPSTRSAGNRRRGKGFHVYEHELEEFEHVHLLENLRLLDGMVVLSGYPSSMYESMLFDWRCIERVAYADGGRARTECLWINEHAQNRLRQDGQLSLI